MEKYKLLIIDDDPDLLISLKTLLEKENYDVSACLSKEEGIKMLSKVEPDLLILDIMMETDLEGYNFLDELRKIDTSAALPVIIYSGMADAIGVNFRSAVEDEKLNPNAAFVDKSEDIEVLLNKIKEYI